MFAQWCEGQAPVTPRSQLVVLGSISISGAINKVEELANVLQVCFDARAKRILLPMASAVDIPTVPPKLFAKFQISFYQSARGRITTHF
jgi:ATP-dependent Lon protease